jgi:O-antigen ligase
VYDPAQLVSADSENRWGWWKEAAGAISARPVQGWGAGSFGVTHLLYRRDTLSVQQPHSVPLQFLAETGIVGAVLGLGCLTLLLTTAARAPSRMQSLGVWGGPRCVRLRAYS